MSVTISGILLLYKYLWICFPYSFESPQTSWAWLHPAHVQFLWRTLPQCLAQCKYVLTADWTEFLLNVSQIHQMFSLSIQEASSAYNGPSVLLPWCQQGAKADTADTLAPFLQLLLLLLWFGTIWQPPSILGPWKLDETILGTPRAGRWRELYSTSRFSPTGHSKNDFVPLSSLHRGGTSLTHSLLPHQ